MRAAGERHGEVLGTGRVRATGGRQLQHLRAHSRRRQRPHRRRRSSRPATDTRVRSSQTRTLRCWGENREGQLGNGTTANPGTAQPVTVSGISGATAVTTGAYHTCALLGNGTVRCWGRNHQGQLGNGTVTSSSTSVAVSGLTGVTAISGGGVHTCAVLTDGTMRCWGEKRVRADRQRHHRDVDHAGAGDGHQQRRRRRASGGDTAVRSLADGTVRCWGENANGQLGNGGDRECDHSRVGQWNHHCRRRDRRVVAAQLRAPEQRHGALLGREPVGSVRQRHHHQFPSTPVTMNRHLENPNMSTIANHRRPFTLVASERVRARVRVSRGRWLRPR